MRKKWLYAVLLAGCLLLTACGSKKDDVADELSKLNSELSHSGTDANTDAVENGIPDRLEYEFSTNSGYKVKVNADVDAEGSESIGVYDMQGVTVDSAYIKKLGDSFFGADNYTYIKPYAAMTGDELEEEMAYMRERFDSLEQSGKYFGVTLQYYLLAQFVLEQERNSDIINQEEELVFKLPFWDERYCYADTENVNAYASFGDGYSIADSECSRLRGIIDDVNWEMCYEAYNLLPESAPNNNKINVETRRILFRNMDVSKRIMYEVKSALNEENACDYDTARQEAENVLQRLGYGDDWTVIRENQLQLGEESSDSEVDGYVFYYSPKLGQGSGVYFGENMICTENINGSGTSYTVSQPRIVVRVTSEGLRGIDIEGIYSEPREMTGDAKVLSFDKVDSIAKEYMTEHIDTVKEIDHVSFGYACVSYDGNDCAMVPVWVYYSGYNKAYEDGTPLVIVNALDGSTIDADLWILIYGYYPYIEDYGR